TAGERPAPLPECPLCGGVFNNLNLAESEQKKLESIIWSKDYQQSRTGNSWHRHALLKEKLGRPALELSQAWLEAAWASPEVQKRSALAKAAEYLENHLLVTESLEVSDELHLKLADLYRQLGDFTRATQALARIKDPSLSQKVRLEKSLILTKSTASTAVPDGNRLHQAIRSHDLSMVRQLAGHRQLQKETDSHGRTPLLLAVELNQSGTVSSMIESGIDPQAPGTVAALHFAAGKALSNICRLLIEAGVSFEQRDSGGNNLLHLVCAGDSSARLELAKYLIEAGININQRNFADLTPFHVAATSSSATMLKLLVKNGAKLNARLPDGRTALFICRNDLIKTLFDLGIDYHAVDNQGQTAFIHALLTGNRPRINEFKSTGHFGSILSEKDNSRKFWQAIKENDVTDFKKMIELQPDLVKLKEISLGECPLHLAVLQENHEMIELLLQKEAEPDCTNDYNRTPLHYAAMKGNLKIVKQLNEAGANIHAVDARGSTPLHEAASAGAIEVFNYLVNLGAADSTGNNAGKSPKELLKNNN
ncbi:MAG: ankyrin repeat domain-containing protein, partial [Candidatus Rifleibacteriota bacterium]